MWWAIYGVGYATTMLGGLRIATNGYVPERHRRAAAWIAVTSFAWPLMVTLWALAELWRNKAVVVLVLVMTAAAVWMGAELGSHDRPLEREPAPVSSWLDPR